MTDETMKLLEWDSFQVIYRQGWRGEEMGRIGKVSGIEHNLKRAEGEKKEEEIIMGKGVVLAVWGVLISPNGLHS